MPKVRNHATPAPGVKQDGAEMFRNVANPPHYTHGSIECIDYIEDQDFPFHLANAVKYITRCRFKGAFEQDVRKAIWYLERCLKLIEKRRVMPAEEPTVTQMEGLQ